MKKLALILSLISFVCFVAFSGVHAQTQSPTKKEAKDSANPDKNKPEDESPKGTAANTTTGDKTAKCAKAGEKGHVCTDACKKSGKGCCADKKGCAKDAKGCCAKDKKTEKELK